MPNIGETQEAMSRPGPGWLECIGLSVRRDEFPELFEKIGSRHGALNLAHFNLPSTPYTYIYAGSAADKISETAPSVPGETVDMVPVSVPASPISNVAMEPRPSAARQIGPEDPMPGTRVIGGAPGSVAETQKALSRVLPVAEATGAQRVDQLQELAGGQVDEAAGEKPPAQANGAPTPTDSAAAQRAAATARVKSGPAKAE